MEHPTSENKSENNEPQRSSKISAVRHWFRDRFGIGPVERNFLYRRVTKTPWYYGDGAALLLLLGVLVGTGAFLALDYSPSPGAAYESVTRITTQQRLGWFVRGLHYWSAGMMVVVIVYHILRQILIGGYKPPREGIWLVGVILFFLVWINAFTGYTLRWDERAIYAMRVAVNLFFQVPFIGEKLALFVQGGWSIGESTLSRFYAVHVLFVPLLLLGLAAYHLYLVVLHGVTTIAERVHDVESAEEQKRLQEQQKQSERTGEEFHPYTAFQSAVFGLVVFSIVCGLTLTLGPPELYPKANLVETSIPKEEWWFYWYSALIAHLPPAIAPHFQWAFPVILFLILISLPVLGPSGNRGIRRRPVAVGLSIFILISILGLTNLRMRSPWTAWPTSELPPLPPQARLSEDQETGRRLFTRYGCFNCHAFGKRGSGVGANLTGTEAKLSKEELHRFILEPPSNIPMPSYRGHLNQEDLDKIVEFVLVAQTWPKEF